MSLLAKPFPTEAVKRGWNSFTCVRCPNYTISHVSPENSIEAFATQRKSA